MATTRRRRIVRTIFAVATYFLLVGILWAIMEDLSKVPAWLTLPLPASETPSPLRIHLDARIDGFSLARSSLEGRLEVKLVRGDTGDNPNTLRDLRIPKAVDVHLVHSGEAGYVELGGSPGVVTLTAAPAPPYMRGEGPLRWDVTPEWPAVWYPFDRYRAYVNPRVLMPDPDRTLLVWRSADQMSIELRIPNLLVKSIHQVRERSSAFTDEYEIVLGRPIGLQIMVFVFLGIALFLIWHLTTLADVTTVMWQSLGLVATLWGVRDVLAKNITVFPLAIDYGLLTIYLVVAVILIFKRVTQGMDELPA